MTAATVWLMELLYDKTAEGVVVSASARNRFSIASEAGDELTVPAYSAAGVAYPERRFVFYNAARTSRRTFLRFYDDLYFGWWQPGTLTLAGAHRIDDLLFELSVGSQRRMLRATAGATRARNAGAGGMTYFTATAFGDEEAAFGPASLPAGTYGYTLRIGVDDTPWVLAGHGLNVEHGCRIHGSPDGGRIPRVEPIVPSCDFDLTTRRDAPALGARMLALGGRTNPPRLRYDGLLTRIDEQPLRYRSIGEVTGVMARLREASGVAVASQAGNRIDQAIAAILDAEGVALRRLGESARTLTDWWLDPEEDVLASINRLVRTDGPLARFYEASDGALVFEPHGHRGTATRSTALQRTFSGDAAPVLSGIDSAGQTEVVNSIRVKYRVGTPVRSQLDDADAADAAAVSGVANIVYRGGLGYAEETIQLGAPDDGDLIVIGLAWSDGWAGITPFRVAGGGGWRTAGPLSWRIWRTGDPTAVTLSLSTSEARTLRYKVWRVAAGSGKYAAVWPYSSGRLAANSASAIAEVPADLVTDRPLLFSGWRWQGGSGGLIPNTDWDFVSVNPNPPSDSHQRQGVWAGKRRLDSGATTWPVQPQPIFGDLHPITHSQSDILVVTLGATLLWEQDELTVPAGGMTLDLEGLDPYEAGTACFLWRTHSGSATVTGVEVSPTRYDAVISGNGATLRKLALFAVPGRYLAETAAAKNDASIATFGERVRLVDIAPYVSAADAQAIAQAWADYCAQPRGWVRARVPASQSAAALDACYGLELGDRVRVVESRTGLDLTGFVEGIRERVSGPGIADFLLTVLEA